MTSKTSRRKNKTSKSSKTKKTKYSSTKKQTKKDKSKTESIRKKGRNCRVKYLYIVATGASQKTKTSLFLGSNDDAPIVSKEAQIWMVCRPYVNKDEPQYYYIFDELGRILTHRICGDNGNVIIENIINVNSDHAKWLIDNVKHKIYPYGNHLLALDYDPTRKYGIIVRRANFHINHNQIWDFKDKITNTSLSKKDRARVWEFDKNDIEDLFVSYQHSKLLKYAKSLPCYGYVKVEESPKKVFCYIDVSHWDMYADKFREKLIEYYDFADSSSLYYFINKYYPFIAKHHGLTPKSKLYLATNLYKKGYHISLYQNSKTMAGKKMNFKCVGLNHLVNRSYTEIIDSTQSQYAFAPNRYYGIAWFFIETEFKAPMTCFNSQMPIPHVSIGLILYEPSSGTSQKSDTFFTDSDSKKKHKYSKSYSKPYSEDNSYEENNVALDNSPYSDNNNDNYHDGNKKSNKKSKKYSYNY